MAHAGVLLGLALLIVLALRGVNILVASLLGALVVAVTNAQPIAAALMDGYTVGMMGFAGRFFLVFLMGAIFGRVMGESRAATAIALALSRKLGPERVLVICTLACALLTYGGVNVFIVVFTVYPLALSLMQEANLPKRLLVGPVMLGAGTFTMTALPGTPSVQNVVAAQGLGTSLMAAPFIGLFVSAVVLGLGLWYVETQRQRAQRNGETFAPTIADKSLEAPDSSLEMPHWGTALVPLLAVLFTIMVPLWLARLVFSGAEELPAVIAFSQEQPVLWTSLAMVIGSLIGVGLFWRYLPKPSATISRGAENAALPLLNTAAVIGFGAVVNGTEAFQWFASAMVGSGLPPLVSAALSVNIVAGIVGSASGGLGIFMETLAPYYLEQGVRPETLHRIIAIGSGGLDSLPHSGAVITTFTVMGLTHREGYRDAAVVTIAIPLAALALVLAGLLIAGG